MNLSEKMEEWGVLKSQLDILETEVIEEVLALEKTQKVDNVTASYSKGRGKYDYEAIAKPHKPDDGIIQENTKFSIDWKGICERLKVEKMEMEEFYTEGKPSVKLKLK